MYVFLYGGPLVMHHTTCKEEDIMTCLQFLVMPEINLDKDKVKNI